MLSAARLLTLLIPLFSTQARADLASETLETLYYYYVDDEVIHRAGCPGGAVLVDRAVCTKAPSYLLVKEVRQPVYDRYKADLDLQDTQLAELDTKITRIDLKIKELLATGDFPDPARAAELEARVNALEGKIGEEVTVLADLAVQIKQIEDRLADHPNGDLMAQLLRLRGEREAHDGTLHSLQKDRDAARSELIALSTGVSDAETFRVVKEQRRAAVANWERVKTNQADALKRVVYVDRLFAYMSDDGMIHEQRPAQGSTPVNTEIFAVTEKTYAEAYRALTDFEGKGMIADRSECIGTCWVVGMVVVPPTTRRLSEVRCEIHSAWGKCTHPDVFATNEVSTSEPISRQNPEHLTRYAEIFAAPPTGRWPFQVTCTEVVSGFRPDLSCHVILE